ncbi:hypothetical protein T439DRAFT_328274 [Meredithblackwellia eburnea MCA 4105]
MATIPLCSFCTSSETLADKDEDGKTSSNLLCCARCQQVANRKVWYCSTQCQRADYKHHKKICGTLQIQLPNPTQLEIVAQQFVSTTLPDKEKEGNNDERPPTPITRWEFKQRWPIKSTFIDLPATTANLLPHLIHSAQTRSQLADSDSTAPSLLPLILIFSLLIPFVDKIDGKESDLIAQLESEYPRLVELAQREGGLKSALDDEEDWEEDQLWEAVGELKGAKEALLAWQIEEAETTR